jgi:acyl-CoA thioester hydrolase
VKQYLIENGVLEIEKSVVIGLVAETMCSYFKSLGFPSKVSVGLRVGRLGNSSVRYEIGVFCEQDEMASAQGHFVHVYLDRVSGRPMSIPKPLRLTVAGLVMPPA